jgi:hypothetical protein
MYRTQQRDGVKKDAETLGDKGGEKASKGKNATKDGKQAEHGEQAGEGDGSQTTEGNQGKGLKRKGSQGSLGTPEGNPKKARSALDLTMNKATKIKGEYSATLTSACEIMTAVQSGDVKWKWANTPDCVGELQERVQALKTSVDDKGFRKFLLKSVSELKKDQGGDSLMKDVQSFVDVLPPLISAVQKRVRGLLSMQQARLANE